MEVSFFDRVGTVPVLVERHGQMNEATDPGVDRWASSPTFRGKTVGISYGTGLFPVER
jgi:hypothetical protein